MSSREKILHAISLNKPSFIEPPVVHIDRPETTLDERLRQYISTLQSIGGKAFHGIDAIKEDLREAVSGGAYTINTIPALGIVDNEVNSSTGAAKLEPVYKAYIEAHLGVAENGAVWIYEGQMTNRLLPFICQHLVILLKADSIVSTMHDAYKRIDIAREGYGVFLAGPSKTADIEQSLVIGAHGARSLVAYLY